MKRMFLILSSIVLIINTITGQDDYQKIENFNRNTWGWEEFSRKGASAIIQDGKLMLSVNPTSVPIGFFASFAISEPTLSTMANFPVDVTRNFRITYKFVAPKLKKSSLFIGTSGLRFELGQKLFTIANNETSVKEKIALDKMLKDSGGKIEVIVTKSGKKISCSVNGMTLGTIDTMLVSNKWTIGLIAFGKASVEVDEIIIDQATEEDY